MTDRQTHSYTHQGLEVFSLRIPVRHNISMMMPSTVHAGLGLVRNRASIPSNTVERCFR